MLTERTYRVLEVARQNGKVTILRLNYEMSSALLTFPLVEFKYPVLASKKGLNVQPIRSLSDQEIATLDSHKKAFIDARGRFKLFEIVKRNFGEWERFIQVLEDPE